LQFSFLVRLIQQWCGLYVCVYPKLTLKLNPHCGDI
jgi:hypothetical protein